ncbi:DUF21 domain-containing protein [Patescibacteria group bacterium]|nr:DUF21 domain-containing protein [Patescibacteria group bacterium]
MTYIVILILVALSALFSGLTLGLLSLNVTDLERKAKLGNKDAEKILKVRKKGNFLLCTLLLGNVAVNSTLSIFLGTIASGVIAGFIATTLIVILGEIIPQATCSRHALAIGSKTTWLVQIFLFVGYPICYPLSLLLDKILGEELPTVWHKKELAEIIKYHEDSEKSEVNADEERIMLGALSFSDKSVCDIITPKPVVFALEVNTALTPNVLSEIKKHGFTRVPIYEKTIDNIVGVLYTKDLIGSQDEKIIAEKYKKFNIFKVNEYMKLDVLMNQMIAKRNHLAFVYDEFASLIGIVTLEDVIEEVLGREIVDETDTIISMRDEARKIANE